MNTSIRSVTRPYSRKTRMRQTERQQGYCGTFESRVHIIQISKYQPRPISWSCLQSVNSNSLMRWMIDRAGTRVRSPWSNIVDDARSP